MKRENIVEDFHRSFQSSNDFSGQIMDQIKVIRKCMSDKALWEDSVIVLRDCLDTLEVFLRALDWPNHLEKVWVAEVKKLKSNYPLDYNGNVQQEEIINYMREKSKIDCTNLLRISLDIGIIEQNLDTKINEQGV